MFRKARWSVTFLFVLFYAVVSTGCFFPAGGPAPQQSSRASGGARATGTLTMVGDDPPTLDPALVQDTTSSSYVVHLFSGLVTLNEKLQIVPDLAESWDISSDGTVYTFKLRKDAKFHDGRPVTAKDFKYSLERAADPKTESVVADTYLGDIVGAQDKLGGKTKQVRGIKDVDDHTLQLTIDAPKAYFLAKLTYPTAFVVDEQNVTKGGRVWTDRPNGTGPFKLDEWRKGERITLSRNDNYVLGAPALAGVVYLLAGGSPMTMYENGEIDVTDIGLTDLDRVLNPAEPLNKELKVTPQLSIGYFGMNVTKAPFDDAKVRQAFNMSVDKDRIVSAILQNAVQKADGILPPGMPGYNPNLKGLGFDSQKAKALIAQSKYGDVSKFPPITLSIPGAGGNPGRLAQAAIEMWKQNLGVEVHVQQVEWATYLDDLKKRKFQMFQVGWSADYPDPQDFLDILFHSKSNDNNTGYGNPQLDRLLEQARTEKDPQKRLAMYQQAEQIIVEDASWVPMTFDKHYVLVKPYVENYVVAPMIIPHLRYVSITK